MIFKFPMQTSTRSSIHFSSPRETSVPKCFRQSRGNSVLLVKNVITPPPPPAPLLTIRKHVQHVNYVTHLAGMLRHPTPKFNS